MKSNNNQQRQTENWRKMRSTLFLRRSYVMQMMMIFMKEALAFNQNQHRMSHFLKVMMYIIISEQNVSSLATFATTFSILCP